MTFLTEVKARLRTSSLVQLSDIGDTNQTTEDDTLLGLVLTDIESAFESEVGVAFDVDNARHLAAAMRGVILLLRLYKFDTEDAGKQYDFWMNRLAKDRIRYGANARIVPKTTSLLTPATEADAGEVRRPDFDPNASFGGIAPSLRGGARGRNDIP